MHSLAEFKEVSEFTKNCEITSMTKLNYTARRADGTTISDIRSIILREEVNIEHLKKRTASCVESRNEFISRLSQSEREQLVIDNASLFPNGLPSVDEIRFTGQTPTENAEKRSGN